MAIKIKNAPVHEMSGHAAAAETVAAEETTEVSVKETHQAKPEEPDQISHSHETTQLPVKPDYEVVEVGMKFKMPIANFTMLEFSISRSSPTNDAEATFQANKEWVESKLNDLIIEQQAAPPEPAEG